jgi:ABC-type uncharacterized transport system involved in gliding motility auxiliary subunit
MVKRILSIVGWIGTALVFVAVAIRFGFPAKDQYGSYLAWAGLVCVLAYTAGQWREIASVFGGRQARYGTLAGVSLLVVLGILIAVNYIGARENKRWDLTTNKSYSLSDQTRNILSKLDSPLQVFVFAQEQNFQPYQDRLKEYEYASKQVTTQYIDPDRKPLLAKSVINEDRILPGTILFKYKTRSERVTTNSEQDITTAIIKVISGQQKKVYFTQGHDEHDPASAERDGYNSVAAALGRENYTAEKLVLAQKGSVPDDAVVVVVAGPRIDFYPPEIDALKKYLDKGGKLLLELDPPQKVDSPPLTNLIALAHDWGVTVGNDVVVDASGAGRLIGTDASVPLAASYPSHPITQRFRLLTAYPLARSVTPIPGGVNGHIAQGLVETSEQSWAETDIKGLLTTGQVKLDVDKGDKPGPITLAAAVAAPVTGAAATPKPDDKSDAPKPETRVVVVGDSDFAGNVALGVQGNRDLFMNIVGWLSQQENLIAIRPKEADDRRIVMTAAQQANLAWLTLLIIPGFIFGTGIYTWMRRR